MQPKDIAEIVAAQLGGRPQASPSLAELRTWRDGLHAVLRVVSDAIAIADFTGAIVYVNEAVCAMLGLRHPMDVIGHPIEALYAKRIVLAESGAPLEPSALPGRTGYASDAFGDVRVRFRDPATGDESIVFVRSAAIRDDERRVLALIQVFRDVTTEYRSRRGFELLTDASGALSTSPERFDAIEHLVRLPLAHAADGCFIDVLERDSFQRIAVSCAVSSDSIFADRMRGRFPLPEEPDRALGAVLRGGEPRVLDGIDPSILPGLLGREDVVAKLGPELRSIVIVPILRGDVVLGALTLVSRGRRFDHVDLAFAAGLARTASAALENARLFAAEQRARKRTARLLELTAELSRVRTTSEIARVACRLGAEGAGASSGHLWIVQEDGTLVLGGEHGKSGGSREPASIVVETKAPLWRESSESLAAVPIVVRGETIGAIVFGHDGWHTYDAEERAFCESVAIHCAQALDRARLLDAERRTAERNALLARAGEILSATNDHESTLHNVISLALPELADCVLLETIDADGKKRRLAAAHQDPEAQAILERIAATEIDVPVPPPDLGASSTMTVPLSIRGEQLGTLFLFFRRSRRVHGPSDRADALEVARRAAIAIEQARLYRAMEEAALAARAAAARADEANRIKDQFLAIVSHELRTPLTAIVGWSAIMAEQLQDTNVLSNGLDIIRRNAAAQTKLIEELLEASRLAGGDFRLSVRPVDLLSVTRDAVDVVRPTADAKRVTLTLSTDGATHPVLGDAQRLRQIAWNLLSNAVKFTPEGGAVKVYLDRSAGAVRLTVSDTGEGIAPDLLPHVFERFRQGDSSTSRRYGGLGLGLAIVKRIAELHEGRVEVESPGLGAGATFRVLFPPSSTPVMEERSPAPALTETARRRRPLSGVRVLVVDDDADTRDLLGIVLQGAGAEVTTAPGAASAIETLRHEPADILVSDIGMPGEDGYSLIHRIRSLPADAGAHVPAVALTAYATPEDRKRALSAGFDQHLYKPIDPSQLVRVLTDLLARSARDPDRKVGNPET